MMENIKQQYVENKDKEHLVYGILIDSLQHKQKFLDSHVYVEYPSFNPIGSEVVLLKLVIMPDDRIFGYTFIPAQGNYDVSVTHIYKKGSINA